MPWAFLTSLVLVFAMGASIQRGNTCTVVAFDDLIHRRSPQRLLAIAYAWLLVAGVLSALREITGFEPAARLFAITGWSVVGGLLLGIGAVTNGACTTGTVARIGSGEYVFLLTIGGFFLGCLIAPPVFGRGATTHIASTPTTTSLDHPVAALIGLAIVVALTLRRVVAGRHETLREFLRNSWDPRTAMLSVSLMFVALISLSGAWAYTDLLGDISREGVTSTSGPRLAFLVALLAGAVVAGRTQRGNRLIGPLTPRLLRCSIGGIIMGTGFSLAPGSFDGLTLFSQPLLLPFAWVVMASCYVAVTLGILYLRSYLGDWIKTRRG